MYRISTITAKNISLYHPNHVLYIYIPYRSPSNIPLISHPIHIQRVTSKGNRFTHEAKPSFSHKSSHHCGVTRSPNHMCETSCATRLASANTAHTPRMRNILVSQNLEFLVVSTIYLSIYSKLIQSKLI